jgi:FkbM family methyltransferase
MALSPSRTGTLFYKRTKIHGKNIRVYWQILGVRGTLATLANLVFGYPHHLTITTEGVKHPLFVRLRTSDVEVYRDTFLQQEYHYPTLFSPRTIVDVGANCGLTSVFYANRYPDATVIAVEAEASNYAALVRNTRPYPKIIPIHAALWHTDGQVEVFAPWPRWKQWGKWGFRVRQGNGCRALTLTTLMHEVGIENVDILKMDIEGAEREIFSNCDWIDKVKLLAIELHDRENPGCSDAVNAVATGHRKTERGLVTFYVR